MVRIVWDQKKTSKFPHLKGTQDIDHIWWDLRAFQRLQDLGETTDSPEPGGCEIPTHPVLAVFFQTQQKNMEYKKWDLNKRCLELRST